MRQFSTLLCRNSSKMRLLNPILILCSGFFLFALIIQPIRFFMPRLYNRKTAPFCALSCVFLFNCCIPALVCSTLILWIFPAMVHRTDLPGIGTVFQVFPLFCPVISFLVLGNVLAYVCPVSRRFVRQFPHFSDAVQNLLFVFILADMYCITVMPSLSGSHFLEQAHPRLIIQTAVLSAACLAEQILHRLIRRSIRSLPAHCRRYKPIRWTAYSSAILVLAVPALIVTATTHRHLKKTLAESNYGSFEPPSMSTLRRLAVVDKMFIGNSASTLRQYFTAGTVPENYPLHIQKKLSSQR